MGDMSDFSSGNYGQHVSFAVVVQVAEALFLRVQLQLILLFLLANLTGERYIRKQYRFVITCSVTLVYIIILDLLGPFFDHRSSLVLESLGITEIAGASCQVTDYTFFVHGTSQF